LRPRVATRHAVGNSLATTSAAAEPTSSPGLFTSEIVKWCGSKRVSGVVVGVIATGVAVAGVAVSHETGSTAIENRFIAWKPSGVSDVGVTTSVLLLGFACVLPVSFYLLARQ
jgi:hypothetical protein